MSILGIAGHVDPGDRGPCRSWATDHENMTIGLPSQQKHTITLAIRKLLKQERLRNVTDEAFNSGLMFSAASVMSRLDGLTEDQLNRIEFGVIRMDPKCIVTAYNTHESQASGLSPANVIGKQFFTMVGECMNNYLVADRFETEESLDLTLDYVLTFRVRRSPVRLRLLKSPASRHSYLLIERRNSH